MIGQDVGQVATGPGPGARASCVRQLSVASFNVDRAGASKVQHTLDFAKNFQADAYALQEIDIKDLEMPRYVHSWRQAGLQIVLSQPELPNRSRRVGLATSLPVRPFPLQGSLAATRVAAGLVQVQSAGHAMPLLIAAIYGFPGDRASTDRVVQQVLDEIRALRCLFVLIGDFNWQCGEGGLLEALLAAGQLRNLDDSFSGPLPSTSPNRVRRIDFGVGHPLIAATRVDHEEGPADHVAVRYGLDFELNFRGHCLPKRAPLVMDRSDENIEVSFREAWNEHDFVVCLEDERLDDAWGLLSCAAEVALGAERGSGNPRATAGVPCKLLVLRRVWLASEGCVVDSSSSSWRLATTTSGGASRHPLRDSVNWCPSFPT